MIRASLCLFAVLAIGACDKAEQAVDKAGRTTAKAAVDEILVTQFPFIPKNQITPYAGCVINSASSAEILVLTRDAIGQVGQSTLNTVQTILTRPEAIKCIAEAGLTTQG
jgi:hypothetical protein